MRKTGTKKTIKIICIIIILLLLCLKNNKVKADSTEKVTSRFSEETQRIVEEHINDFNYDTFDAFMETMGDGNKNKGFEKYIKNELGGIFAQYYGKKMPCKTAGDLQRAAEYVWGLMTIYGFDYSNAESPYSANKWRGYKTPDSFFNRDVGQANQYFGGVKNIDERCKKGGLYAVTNCNYGVDYLLNKMNKGSCLGSGGTSINDVRDLKVGDYVHFYNLKHNKRGQAVWVWYHVAIVGEVYPEEGTVVTYDAGHAFTNTGNYRVISNINNANKLKYGYDRWQGIRKLDLEETTSTTDQFGNKSGIFKGKQISNCRTQHAEQADQYRIQDWYNGSWDVVLRYPDQAVANEIARVAIDAANNDLIGYSQESRTTYGTQLKNAGYEPSKITSMCWADCSSSTSYNVIAAGHNLNISKLENIEVGTTSTIENTLRNVGFQALKGSEYLSSSNALQPGDILLHTGSHVCIYVGGANVDGGVDLFYNLPVDDITVNFDELIYDFAGTPKKVALNESKQENKWLFNLASQFLDFISNILINSIKDSILGWTKIIENIVNSLLNNVNNSIVLKQ